jgi:hypothetical protein
MHRIRQTPVPEYVRRHWRIIDEIERQTDRGAAIIGAAYLEERLTEAIRSRFVPGNNIETDLLGFSGAVGTFSAKIDLAFLLGLIGPQAYRDLHLIRRIRNDFAHVMEPLTFAAPKVANRCRELYLPTHLLMPGQNVLPQEPRAQYLAAVMLLFNLIWGEMYKKKAPAEPAVNTP